MEEMVNELEFDMKVDHDRHILFPSFLPASFAPPCLLTFAAPPSFQGLFDSYYRSKTTPKSSQLQLHPWLRSVIGCGKVAFFPSLSMYMPYKGLCLKIKDYGEDAVSRVLIEEEKIIRIFCVLNIH